jgi:hypothetical protein
MSKQFWILNCVRCVYWVRAMYLSSTVLVTYEVKSEFISHLLSKLDEAVKLLICIREALCFNWAIIRTLLGSSVVFLKLSGQLATTASYHMFPIYPSLLTVLFNAVVYHSGVLVSYVYDRQNSNYYKFMYRYFSYQNGFRHRIYKKRILKSELNCGKVKLSL